MAEIQPTGLDETPKPRRKAARYGVPVAVAGVAAAAVGLVPALADTGDPDLPKISAEKLVAKMLASDVNHLSGTVQVENDLGLPGLPGGLGGSGGGGDHRGGPFGGGHEQRGADERGQESDDAQEQGSQSAAPQQKLMELASGEHTLRVAADGPDKQRVSVVEDAAEYSFIRNGNEFWTYDSGTDSAFHGIGPKAEHGKGGHGKDGHGKGGHKRGAPGGLMKLTPQEAADKAVQAAGETTTVSVDGTAKVAGRDAYQLLIEPKDAAQSTVDSIRIAVDADNGTPLSFRLTPEGGGKAAIDIAYTEVDFAKPDADTFAFTPPKGADVTEKKLGTKDEQGDGRHHDGQWDGQRDGKRPGMSGLSGLEVLGEGWDAIARVELPQGDPGRPGDDRRADAGRLLDTFTDKVKGDFGTGRVFESRLINALITDDGTVYAGAVTKEGLVEAAERAERK